MKFHHLLGATALVGSLLIAPAAAAQTVPAAPAAPAANTAAPVTPEEQATSNDEGEAVSATGEVESGDSIIVTGSLIARPQVDGNIPGVQITGEQIQARAFTNVLDAINDQPLVGPGASPFGTNGGQPASLGSAFPDILDLGTNRTLTLVNGRRFVSGNAASLFVQGNTSGSQVDLNSIPAAIVQRSDVLAATGAVAYGSDAIAGVVNLILKTDFEGLTLSGLSGVSERGDAAFYRLTAVAGTNFASGRGNVSATFEYNRDNALTAASREQYRRNIISPTSFLNGSVRNTAFAPSLSVTATSGGAFLPQATDGVPNNIAGRGFSGGTVLVSDVGQIFQFIGTAPTGFNQGIITAASNAANGFRPNAFVTQAGNTNLVPGNPIGTGNGCAVTNLTNFCNFAPLALPGSRATAAATAQRDAFTNAVIARFAPTLSNPGAAAAQRDNLALELLKANIQTPREYLARNPGTNINAFIGTFIPNFLDVANTGAAAGVLPQTAVPLRFDAAGNVVGYTVGVIDNAAETPGTTGGAPGGDFFVNLRNTNLRVQQDRYIANLFGTYEIAPELTLFTENLYANIRNVSPFNGASSNTITSGTTENAVLLMDINNPYLNASSAATLRAAGVTSKFLVSRTNQDIQGFNPTQTINETYRTLIGARGNFDAFGQRQRYEIAGSYARSEITGSSFQIKDIEYALAVDAVRDTSGNIVCRAQTNPTAFVGQTPSGVAGLELVRERGADGVVTERLVRRAASADQVSACRPLNVFGTGNFTQEARDYVLARTGFNNISSQYFGRASLGGGFFNLPGGTLTYGLVGEYRREELSYRADQLSQVGATRTVALAATEGFTETYEFGGQLGIPIFGEDFKIPLFQSLNFEPGIRFSKQRGRAPDVRLLNGSTLNQSSSGDWNQIYQLGGDWNPIPDLRIRGNWTRSIRNPNVVELFLGGQPSFTAPTDPCSAAQIGSGTRPTVRRANCVAAVIASGIAGDSTAAESFLNGYVPSGVSVAGSFAGSPNLRPERGQSWSIGGVLQPRFARGFSFSLDYLNVRVLDTIVPTGVATALQVCFDSPNFPNTAPDVGVNVCSFFNRIGAGQARQFEIDNGFASGYINLGAIRVEGLNAVMQYDFGLDGLLGSNAGRFQLYASAYHPLTFLTAPDGDFSAAQQSAGSFARPEVETQLRGRYENSGFYTQWVWNWTSRTRLFQNGAPVAGTDQVNEVQDYLVFPAYGVHNATIGYNFGEQQRFGMQLAVQNVFDKFYTGPFPQAYGSPTQTLVDNIGRRFVVSANIRF